MEKDFEGMNISSQLNNCIQKDMACLELCIDSYNRALFRPAEIVNADKTCKLYGFGHDGAMAC